jgi:hypothetical protein
MDIGLRRITSPIPLFLAVLPADAVAQLVILRSDVPALSVEYITVRNPQSGRWEVDTAWRDCGNARNITLRTCQNGQPSYKINCEAWKDDNNQWYALGWHNNSDGKNYNDYTYYVACPACDPGNHYDILCSQCSFDEDLDNDCTADCDECVSPVIIDLEGNGFALTDVDGGVRFDLDSDGQAETVSWTAGGTDDVWLALDRNENGVIDNGGELFGKHTIQSLTNHPNGYLALAEYDKPENGGNNDGKIDSSDAIWPSLIGWRDLNHNGISDPSELHTLDSLGITGIDLSYKESRWIDQDGNEFVFRAKVYRTRGEHVFRWSFDVFLDHRP